MNYIETETPNIVFKLENTLYTVNSIDVVTIMRMPNPQPIPDSPKHLVGIITYQNNVVPLIDLRTFFGIPSLNDEYQEFVKMLELRKNDHIHWANELEKSIDENYDFKLTTDPHKCAFGQWYDHYQSDNNAVNFHLRKIDEPHKTLHKAADDVKACKKECEHCKKSECVKDILKSVKEEYVPTIVGLLDHAKEIFKDSYHEMLLIVNIDGFYMGIIVDEVLSVEHLEALESTESISAIDNKTYVLEVKKSSKLEGLILELDYKKLGFKVSNELD